MLVHFLQLHMWIFYSPFRFPPPTPCLQYLDIVNITPLGKPPHCAIILVKGTKFSCHFISIKIFDIILIINKINSNLTENHNLRWTTSFKQAKRCNPIIIKRHQGDILPSKQSKLGETNILMKTYIMGPIGILPLLSHALISFSSPLIVTAVVWSKLNSPSLIDAKSSFPNEDVQASFDQIPIVHSHIMVSYQHP